MAIALSGNEEGRTVPEGPPGAQQGRAESPYLGGLPWLWQPQGNRVVTDAPKSTVGLAFPSSVPYREAVESLYMSVTQSGTLPSAATVVAAPPRGIVLQREAGRYVISLAAPWGYDPTSGVVRLPRLRFPPGVSASEALEIQSSLGKGPLGRTLPQGIRLVFPKLPACQVATKSGSGPQCPFLGVADRD
jgi:hypothetical protein